MSRSALFITLFIVVSMAVTVYAGTVTVFNAAACAGSGNTEKLTLGSCTPDTNDQYAITVTCTGSTANDTWTFNDYSNQQCSGTPIVALSGTNGVCANLGSSSSILITCASTLQAVVSYVLIALGVVFTINAQKLF